MGDLAEDLMRAASLTGRAGPWCRTVPLLAWTAMILFVASRPTAFFFPEGTTAVYGVPRHLLQYPYHVTVFFVLTILLFWRLHPGLIGKTTTALAVLAGCVLVSLASELLQAWVPTRTPAFRDLGLDFLGSVLGIVTVHSPAWPGRREGR